MLRMLVNLRAFLDRSSDGLQFKALYVFCAEHAGVECQALIATDTGASPSGKAAGFDPAMRWFESSRPCHFLQYFSYTVAAHSA